MSIRERAAAEMDHVKVDPADRDVILKCLETFFDHFNSGGAVSVMAPVLMRCLAGAPLSPLTGEANEWEDRSDTDGSEPGTFFQNRRASSVFKRVSEKGGWDYYDVSEQGHGVGGWKRVEQFPYLPDPHVSDPIVQFETSKAGEGEKY